MSHFSDVRQGRQSVVNGYPKVACSGRWRDLGVVQGDHKILTWGCIFGDVQQLNFARLSFSRYADIHDEMSARYAKILAEIQVSEGERVGRKSESG